MRLLAAASLLWLCAAWGFSGEVRVAELPREAQATLLLIKKGGPFPHAQDGRTFGNRERLLPMRPEGFYREYSVKTPGRQDRGARRIVAGGGREYGRQEYYYTDNHYRSFRRILE